MIIRTVNRRLPHTTCLTPWHWPQSYLLKASHVWGHRSLLATLIKPLVPLKNTCAWHGVISRHLLKHFKYLWRILFFSTRLKTSKLFVPQWSQLNERIKKKCRQKYLKKMQWLQKTFTVIYSQDIRLDDNAMRFSLFRPYLTQPFTFQTSYINICIWPIKWSAASSKLWSCRYCYTDAPRGRWLNRWRKSLTAITQECCV